MKWLYVLVLFISLGKKSYSQENTKMKLDYVIIADGQIISQEKLEEYGKSGRVKAMNKGVSDEEYRQLAARFGEKIGEKDFIIKIDLFPDTNQTKLQTTRTVKVIKDGEDELNLHLNDLAEDFSVNMLDGTSITLSKLRGKVVLINFWATWCAPCLMEFTEMPDKLLNQFSTDDFRFIPISIGETKDQVSAKMAQMKKYGVTFNVGLDPNKMIWDHYASGAIPKNFLIDRKGKVRFISIGNTKGSVERLAAQIKKLVNED